MTQGPLVSFVIATFNRGATLVECLARTLATCGLAPDQYEALVVDNASTDNTAELFAARFPASSRVQLIRLSKNRGPVAKNFGMARARGEFVVLLDDDAYPLPGAVGQMVRHFRDDKALGAAVFDVTLPDGAKEASAYPDVCIGAGTGLRRSVLEKVGLLPGDFFMQAEEYDLSFRILQAGYSVQRFWDMPLMHLKSPGARIGQRTTRLDVRNNLYLLARYVPEPLCQRYAGDWLARYWIMALQRDEGQAAGGGHPEEGTHKKAYLRGAAEGMARWTAKRGDGGKLLSPEVVERIFKIDEIHQRMGRAKERLGLRRVVLADFGKNLSAYWSAARSLGLEVVAVADDALGGGAGEREYRGVPLVRWEGVGAGYDGVIVSNMSPVAGPRRAGALRRVLSRPVVDLFERASPVVHGAVGVAGGRGK